MSDGRDLLRNHRGDVGRCQAGHYFDQQQASEMHVCPGNYTVWDYAIGVVTLSDGTFLAWHGLPAPHDDGAGTWRGRTWGGFSSHSRRYPSRDAAVRSNAAYCIWFARKQHRLPRGGFYQGDKISDDRYRQIVKWVFGIAGQRAPQTYIAPPAPSPVTKPADKSGQLGFAL